MDQLLSEFMFDHKCYRWWFRPYIYFFYVSVFNSFKYYSLSNQNQNVSLKNYIVELSKALCGDKITKKRGAPFKLTNRKKIFHMKDKTSNENRNETPSSLCHLPTKIGDRKRCASCHNKSQCYCDICQVALCYNLNSNCYLNYHKLDLLKCLLKQ